MERAVQIDEAASPISRAILLAPLVFILHVIEEAPGFVEWANAHVEPDITTGTFWSVNTTGLIVTLVVVGMIKISPSPLAHILAIGWLSFLMPANAIIHIVGSVIDEGYAPGVVTAIVLYIPYYFFLMMKIKRSGRVDLSWMIGAAGLGSIPMLVHGYRILFFGSRLF
jgi:hypothetical protein